jgi:WD40 repeat protein
MAAVAFSPDSMLLATVSMNGTARLWNLATVRNVTVPVSVGTGMAISHDARTVAGIDADGALRLWNLITGRPGPVIMASGVGAAALSPDGKILATGDDDGTARLWDARTGQPIGKPIAVSSSAARPGSRPGTSAATRGSGTSFRDGLTWAGVAGGDGPGNGRFRDTQSAPINALPVVTCAELRIADFTA